MSFSKKLARFALSGALAMSMVLPNSLAVFQAKVNADSLYLRQSPGGAVITTLSKGTTVAVLNNSSSWYKVSVNGKEGYVSGEYLTGTTSGMLNPGAPDGLQGTELAQAAFKASLGSAGMAFVAICMLFFAFSTIIGWYFFGEQNVKALFGHKAVKVYAAIVVICIVIGSALHVDLVWNLSDLFNGLMVFPNLIALLALSGLVAKAAHDKDIMK